MAELGDKYKGELSFDDFKKGTYWYDHIVEYPGRFKEWVDPEDATIVGHEPWEGQVIQQGTPVNAKNLNLRDHAIWTLYSLVNSLTNEVIRLQTEISTLTGSNETNGFILEVTDFEIIEGWYDVNGSKVVVK